MHIEAIRDFVLSLEEVEETCPFGPNVIVFKTKGRMFLLLPLDTEIVRFNVKCDPEKAIQLRDEYPEHILPGYHMSKVHWNTIISDGYLNQQFLKEQIMHSYKLIRNGKKQKK